MEVFLTVGGLVAFLTLTSIFMQRRKAGPAQLEPGQLARKRTLVKLTPGSVDFQDIGIRTQVEGNRIKFESGDEPGGEAALLIPEDARGSGGNSVSNTVKVQLGGSYTTHHVHTGGYVFNVRVRGYGRAVGKVVNISMIIDLDGNPYGGSITCPRGPAAAVGDWIEVDECEIGQVVART